MVSLADESIALEISVTATLRRRPLSDHGLVHDITPASAGWEHVGFALHRLRAGESAGAGTGTREAILVLVEGHAAVQAGEHDFGSIGDRLDVFDGSPPVSVYVPPRTDWSVTASTDCSLAVCSAPASGDHPIALIDGVERIQRGEGTNLRHIYPIAMEEKDVADRLLVTEVITPPGHWSSYPPHRHDEDDFPRITLLEETYYHRLNPAAGFGLQRVYTDDSSIDETIAFADGDVVLVPRGYHPCAAPHGFELYYLNVMAGPRRQWRFRNHPDFEWLAE